MAWQWRGWLGIDETVEPSEPTASVFNMPDGSVVNFEDDPIFQELKAEGLAMQHRFAAEPIFAKTGKGFVFSEGVANSPAFGQFGFRLEMSRTGTIQASVGENWRKTQWIQVLSETGRNEKPNENGVFELVSRPGIEPGSTV